MLLQQENLTLEKLLEIGRNKELSQKQATEISNTKSSDTTEEEYVNKFNQPRSHSNKQRQTRQSFDRNPEYKTCFKCGGEFTTDHQRSCIAIGKSCYNCGKLNHLSKVCRTKRTDKTVKDRHIRNINDKSDSDSTENDDELEHVFTVLRNSEHVHNLDKTKDTFKSTRMTSKINNVLVNTIIDSGSTINIIDRNSFERIKKNTKTIQLRKSRKKIFPYAVTLLLLLLLLAIYFMLTKIYTKMYINKYINIRST